MIKTLMAFSLALAIAPAFAQNKPMSTTYNVDTATTKVEWTGKKVAGPHNGTISVKSGTVAVMNDVITSGNIVIDMKSINNTDLEGEWKGKLEGHLKSADFFDVEKFPEAILVIKNSKKSKKGLDVNGDITIHGITRPVKFLVTDVKTTPDSFEGKTTLEVDRMKHGVVYNAGKGDKSLIKSLGDKLIYDKFALDITLASKKQ